MQQQTLIKNRLDLFGWNGLCVILFEISTNYQLDVHKKNMSQHQRFGGHIQKMMSVFRPSSEKLNIIDIESVDG